MDDLLQVCKVGVGAVLQVVELSQDPNHVGDRLGELQEQWQQGTLVDSWAMRGEATLAQVMPPPPTVNPQSSPDPDPFPISELEALIQHLAEIRAELRKP